MLIEVILFAIGFAILIKGAGVLVDGSTSLARRLGVPGCLIGLVVVGIGTSIPEFSVAFWGNLVGEAEVSLGTIIGSNTFNILVILGLAAVIRPLHLEPAWVGRDLVWNIFAVAAVVAAVLGNDSSFSGVTREEGLMLLIFFIVWLAVAVRTAHEADHDPKPRRLIALPFAFLAIAAGLAGVVLGGQWVVNGAVAIARAVGMSEAFVGLTIVGIGTSLPELAVTVAAAWRRQFGIAVGNIIGSNVFDFLMIIGASALVRPVPFSQALMPDIVVTLASSLLFFAAVLASRRYMLKGSHGLAFLVLYGLYFTYLVGRG